MTLKYALGNDETTDDVLGGDETLNDALGEDHQYASAHVGTAAYCPQRHQSVKIQSIRTYIGEIQNYSLLKLLGWAGRAQEGAGGGDMIPWGAPPHSNLVASSFSKVAALIETIHAE